MTVLGVGESCPSPINVVVCKISFTLFIQNVLSLKCDITFKLYNFKVGHSREYNLHNDAWL